ncbi:hypothetical protein FPC41_13400 [Marinobacter vulgaris]|nr:hypothetical protein FPC41_13400 [Marinobacter vulgaris]
MTIRSHGGSAMFYRALLKAMPLVFLTTLAFGVSGYAVAVEVERVPRQGPDEIHATVLVPAPVKQVLAVLEEPCHLRRWVPKLASLKILARPRENQTLVYMATDPAWPMFPRDNVILFTRHEGPPITLDMQSRPNAMPEMAGYQRIPFSEGSWTLRTELSDATRVDYLQRVEPGGQMPQWLSDHIGMAHVAELLSALQNYAGGTDTGNCSRDRHNSSVQ